MKIESFGEIALGVKFYDEKGQDIDLMIESCTLSMKTGEPIKLILTVPVFKLDLKINERQQKTD